MSERESGKCTEEGEKSQDEKEWGKQGHQDGCEIHKMKGGREVHKEKLH